MSYTCKCGEKLELTPAQLALSRIKSSIMHEIEPCKKCGEILIVSTCADYNGHWFVSNLIFKSDIDLPNYKKYILYDEKVNIVDMFILRTDDYLNVYYDVLRTYLDQDTFEIKKSKYLPPVKKEQFDSQINHLLALGFIDFGDDEFGDKEFRVSVNGKVIMESNSIATACKNAVNIPSANVIIKKIINGRVTDAISEVLTEEAIKTLASL